MQICIYCKNPFIGWGKPQKCCSRRCAGLNKRGKYTKEKNGKYKGFQRLSQCAYHIRIKKEKPKPKLCELCHKKPPRELSFKKRNLNYTFDPNDYQWVCHKCHSYYDDWGGNRRKGLQYCIDYAKKLDGKCLSKKYVNECLPLRWQCKNKHEWSAPARSIFQGGWCRTCVNKRGYYQLKNYIILHSGRLIQPKQLNDYYGMNKTIVKYRCKNNHINEIRAVSLVVLKTWCPKCHIGDKHV